MDDRACPATYLEGSQLKANSAWLSYGDPLVEYTRLPRIGAGIVSISFPNTNIGDPEACIAAGAGLTGIQPSPASSCVTAVRNAGAPVEEVQVIEFKRWLSGFISRFEQGAGLETGLLSINSAGGQYALSGAGVFYILDAIEDFEERFPELRGSEIGNPIETPVDFSPSDFPLGDDLRTSNQELREDLSVIVAQIGFDQENQLELGVLIGTVVLMIVIGGLIAWFFNAWLALLAAFGVYVAGFFVAPSLFTGIFAAVILLAFMTMGWFQRHGPTD